MTTLLTALWGRAAGWLAAAGGILIAVGSIWIAGVRAGKDTRDRQAMERVAKERRVRDEVERDVVLGGDPRERLRSDWSRD